MKCKNCGARLNKNSTICPNCGANSDGEYVLLSNDIPTEYEDLYSDEKPRRNRKHGKSGAKIAIIIILLIGILAGGGYFAYDYFMPKEQPELSFTSGYGIINGDEPVIYVVISENAQLQYIHGVTAYDGDKALSTDYEYTKNVDGTFRAIFFDIDDVKPDDFDADGVRNYTYNFEMKFSFFDNSTIYTYNQDVEFTNEFNYNVASAVFDHSLQVKDDVSTTAPAQTETTTAQTQINAKFIESGYWFTKPYHDADNYNISAIKFNGDGTCAITIYTKTGKEAWQTTNTKGKYEIKENSVFVSDSEGMVTSYAIKNDNTLDGLTARKYNSTDNADDFFNL